MKIINKFAFDNITEKEISFILAIQQHPLGTYDDLSAITGLPKSSVFEIAKKMKDVFFVTPHMNSNNLELEIIDIFIKADNSDQVVYLELLARNHPYIACCSRIFGKYNGIYLQFKSPIGTDLLINSLFQSLKNSSHIEEYTLFKFGDDIYHTTVDINAWDCTSQRWKFSWKEWFEMPEIIPKVDETVLDVAPVKKKGIHKPKSPLTWIKPIDVAILAELYTGVRRTHKKIKESLSKKNWLMNNSALSRKMTKIKAECISGYRVQIDPKIFDVVNSILIIGYSSEEKLIQIRERIKSFPIPFVSVLKISNYTIYWYIHQPNVHLSEMLYQLHLVLDEMHFYYVDFTRSKSYYLDPDAFDESKHGWKKGRDFLQNEVIEKTNADFEKIKTKNRK